MSFNENLISNELHRLLREYPRLQEIVETTRTVEEVQRRREFAYHALETFCRFAPSMARDDLPVVGFLMNVCAMGVIGVPEIRLLCETELLARQTMVGEVTHLTQEELDKTIRRLHSNARSAVATAKRLRDRDFAKEPLTHAEIEYLIDYTAETELAAAALAEHRGIE